MGRVQDEYGPGLFSSDETHRHHMVVFGRLNEVKAVGSNVCAGSSAPELVPENFL
jgi:hypothetical protein